jgi:hypothetical protein
VVFAQCTGHVGMSQTKRWGRTCDGDPQHPPAVAVPTSTLQVSSSPSPPPSPATSGSSCLRKKSYGCEFSLKCASCFGDEIRSCAQRFGRRLPKKGAASCLRPSRGGAVRTRPRATTAAIAAWTLSAGGAWVQAPGSTSFYTAQPHRARPDAQNESHGTVRAADSRCSLLLLHELLQRAPTEKRSCQWKHSTPGLYNIILQKTHAKCSLTRPRNDLPTQAARGHTPHSQQYINSTLTAVKGLRCEMYEVAQEAIALIKCKVLRRMVLGGENTCPQ